MSGLKELAKRRIVVYCLACIACLTAWLALATWVPAAAAQATDKTSAQPESAPHEQVDAAYQRGMKLLQEKRYNDALEQFRLVEQGAPRSPQGPSGEGIALALIGKPQEAIEAVLERVSKSYKLKKRQQCALIALRPDGEWSSGGLVSGFRAAIRKNDQNELKEAQIIYQRA